MRERFYLPEERNQFFTAEDAEKANISARNQTQFIFLGALLASLFLGSMCYQDAGSFTATGFLIYVAVAFAFLFGLWKFNQRVKQNEEIKNAEKQILPAEELFLSEKDITWEIKWTKPEKVVITWDTIIHFGEMIGYNKNGRVENLNIPRVVWENHKMVVEFIEKYTSLKKVNKEKYIQNEIINYVVYEK
jgi:hypothetical protein